MPNPVARTKTLSTTSDVSDIMSPTFVCYIISVENHERYAGDKAWNFYENDEIKGQFKEEDMRLGVVWRELCLENHQVGIFIFPTIAIIPGSS